MLDQRRSFWAAFERAADDAGFPGRWNDRTSIRHREGPLAWAARARDADGEAEVLIEHGTRDENAALFRALRGNRSAVARSFGEALLWEEVPGRRRFRIAAPTRAGGVRNLSDWAAIQNALLADLNRIDAALRPYLRLAGIDHSWSGARPDASEPNWHLEPGDLIKRTELHARYGGRGQGGIAGSATTPNVMVFSDPRTGKRYGYLDRWQGAVFHYVGEGQVGDQSLTSGNKAIREHAERGKALRVFKGVRGVVRYEGEYGLEADEAWYFTEARDRNGALRKVLVFRMRPIDGGVPASVAIPAPSGHAAVPPGAIGTFGQEYTPASEAASSSPRQPFAVDPDVVDRGTVGHARTQNALAAYLTTAGITPLKPKPPDPDFDLGWSHRAGWYVVEVKSLTDQNEARQLRLALGQVLDYHDALSRRHPVVRAVIAVERRPRDPRWVSLCERHDVLLVWPETFAAVLSRALTDS